MWHRIQTVADIAINHILTREIQSITKSCSQNFAQNKNLKEVQTVVGASVAAILFTRAPVWRSPIPVYRRSRRFGGKITKASVGYPASDKICKLVSEECRFSERAGECGVVHFSTQFFYFEDGSYSMKGGSREAKEDKKYGRRENVVREAEDSDPLSPPPNSQESSL